MLKPAVCSVVNACSGSPEIVGLILLLMVILMVVLTPLLLALGLTYFVMQQSERQDVLPSSSNDQNTGPQMPWPTHALMALRTSYPEYRKAA